MSSSIPEPVILFCVSGTEFSTFAVEATTCEGHDNENKKQDDSKSSNARNNDDDEFSVVYFSLIGSRAGSRRRSCGRRRCSSDFIRDYRGCRHSSSLETYQVNTGQHWTSTFIQRKFEQEKHTSDIVDGGGAQ